MYTSGQTSAGKDGGVLSYYYYEPVCTIVSKANVAFLGLGFVKNPNPGYNNSKTKHLLVWVLFVFLNVGNGFWTQPICDLVRAQRDAEDVLVVSIFILRKEKKIFGAQITDKINIANMYSV